MFQKCLFISLFCFLILANIYAQPGILDKTFGDHGIVVSDIYGRSETLTAMAIQPDQKILAAGYVDPSGLFDFVVVRYLPDSFLDPDFGVNGKVRIDINYGSDRCNAIAIQHDGRILLAGLTQFQSEITFDWVKDFAIVRLNQDGSRDSTFGDAGRVVTDLGKEEDLANIVLIQEDGKIIAAGHSSNLITSSFAMVRYESNGNIDHSFGNNGIVTTNCKDYDIAKAGIIQPDGKILLTGYAGTDSTADFAIVRYKTDGTLDSLFGDNGIVQTDFPGERRTDYAETLILDPDGKILVGGYSNRSFDILVSKIAVARYNSDGSLDHGFGENGTLVLPLGTESEILSMIRQADGKYWLAGRSNFNNDTQQWILARIEKNGEGLDTVFGGGGICTTDGGEQNIAIKVLMQNDAKIVIGGTHDVNNSFDFVLSRFIPEFMNSTETPLLNSFPFTISPSPCTDYISIDAGKQSGLLNCRIIDLAGHVMRSDELNVSSEGALKINTGHLNAGIYMLAIRDNNKYGISRFVVAK